MCTNLMRYASEGHQPRTPLASFHSFQSNKTIYAWGRHKYIKAIFAHTIPSSYSQKLLTLLIARN